MDRRKPELLSPAGDMEKLRMAVAYGADAVYLAGTSFGMRSFTGNFTPDELPKAVQLAHAAGVKVHCTVNIMPRNDEAAALPAYLEQLDAAGVDALILADLGAFTLAGKYAPRCERHISTQQSIANPGMNSIRAALYPAETNYYFYALNADGIHHFSETYYEHQNFLAELAGKTQPDEEQTDAPADSEETTDTENQTDGQT